MLLSTSTALKVLIRSYKTWSTLISRIRNSVWLGISHRWVMTLENGTCLFRDFQNTGKMRGSMMSSLRTDRLFQLRLTEGIRVSSLKDLDGFNIKWRSRRKMRLREWMVRSIKRQMEVRRLYLLYWMRTKKTAQFMYLIFLLNGLAII